jgi:hypothetical protein
MSNQLLRLVLIVSMVASPALAQEQESKITIKPVAISVTDPRIEDFDFDVPPLGGASGTTVAVLLTVGEGQAIVALDEEGSDITAFTDGQGLDLLAAQAVQEDEDFAFSSMQSPIGAFPQTSNDALHMLVELQAPGVPTNGANSVRIEGQLLVLVAGGTVSQTIENVALTPSKLNVPGHDVEITSVGEAQWGDAAMAVTLKLTGESAKRLAAVHFFDAAGQELSDGQELSSMTMFDTTELEYGLTSLVQAATIRLDFYEQLEAVAVPVDLQVTLGL